MQVVAGICIGRVAAVGMRSGCFGSRLSLFASLLLPLNPLKTFNAGCCRILIAFVTRYSLAAGFFLSSSVPLCCTSLRLAQKSGVCIPITQTQFSSTFASVFESSVLNTRCVVVARPYSGTFGLARRQTCGSW